MGVGFGYTVYDVHKLTPTEVYGNILIELGKENPNIVVLTADLGKSTKAGIFQDVFPERFFNFGVAEQNMMSAAAGLALGGKIPFVSTFAVFASMRACEQVRTDIAYPNLNVKIVASHAGISFGQAGTTHHCTEDIGILRTMANMTIIVPADSIETAKAVRECVKKNGPIYIRINRGFEPSVYNDENYNFEIGKSVTFREGNDLTIIACGIAMLPSIEVSDSFKEEKGIGIRILNMHTIKPIDKDAILKAVEETKGIITVEEHNIIGGLGSAVAEIIAESGKNIKFKRIGIPDEYSIIGYPEDLYKYYGIDYNGIYKTVEEMLNISS